MIKKKGILIIYILALSFPFVLTIFFLRTADLILILLLEFIALIIVIITSIFLYRNENARKKKIIFPISAFMVVLLYFWSYGYQMKLSDFLFLKFRQDKLTEMIEEIKAGNDRNTTKERLRKIGIRDFQVLDNGIISFTIDCFLDNGNGLAYSPTGQPPETGSLGCGGSMSNWEKIVDNWYAWGVF